jgi:hypothetical protein
MYPINAASPERIGVGAVVQISDGAVQTSGVSISVRGQGGASGAGGGTTTYDNGIVQYTPTQAETNFTSFVVVAYKTGCIPVAVTIVTSASATAGYAGTDQSKIANPTSTVALTGTTIAMTQKVDVETIKTNPVVNAGTITFPTTATLASTTNITASERNVRQTIESQRGHHTACGAIFYVQKGGSDANPGTYLLPFLTIQAALNACTANAHDTVIVLGVTGSAPSVFSEALTMSKAYVFLRGMGRDTQVTTAGAASSTITISASGCEVSGLWVNNTGTGATKGIETAAGADFAWLHHLFIDGAATGVTVTAGTNVIIENCRINDVTTAGVTVAQGAGAGLTTRILDNHIDGTATGINFAGSDSSESIARYNNISGCTTGVAVASGALKVQVTDNRFAGNTTDWTDAGTDTNLSWNALSTNISGTVARVTLTDTATAVTTVNGLAANVITAASINADAITDAKVAADVTIASVTGAVGSVAAGGITAASIAADAIGASELAADAVTEIAGAVWDIAIASHLTGGTTGEALNAAGAAGDPWTTTLPGAYSAGSAGYIIGTNVNATVSSRLPTASYTAPLDAAGVRTAVGLASANLDTQIDALPTATENADALLKRDWSTVSGEAARSMLNAMRFLRNKWSISAGTLTVTKEDDATSAWTGAVTTTAGDPVSTIDPA